MTFRPATKTESLENPFSAKRLVPGAMPFVQSGFSTNQNGDYFLDDLAARFLESGFGQIIGPHGCGKTTLAKAILDGFEDVSSRFVVVRNQNSIQTIQTLHVPKTQRQVIVLDGVERIPLVHRMTFLAYVRGQLKRDNRLFLITSHKKIFGWPVLVGLQPSFEQFKLLADQLIHNSGVNLERSDMERVYSEAKENYRDAFMKLYDVIRESV